MLGRLVFRPTYQHAWSGSFFPPKNWEPRRDDFGLFREPMTRPSHADQTMNPTSIARTDVAPPRSVRKRLDQLEAQMWDRARMNLMLLYNGSRIDGTTSQADAPATLVGPLAVLKPEI